MRLHLAVLPCGCQQHVRRLRDGSLHLGRRALACGADSEGRPLHASSLGLVEQVEAWMKGRGL